MAQELLDMAATGFGSATSIIPDDMLVRNEKYALVFFCALEFFNIILILKQIQNYKTFSVLFQVYPGLSHF